MLSNKLFKITGMLGILFLFCVTAIPITAAKSSVNSTYAGYQVMGPFTTLRAEGSWIVPTADCSKTPNSQSNISTIIDGISNEKDAMEIGTYQNCVNGVAHYGAFVNVYPMTNYFGENHGNISTMKISPGDVIEAQGTWRPSTITNEPINWNTNIVDETTGVLLDTDAHSPKGFTPVLDSAAVILSSNGKTLTAFKGSIEIGRQYTGVHNSIIAGVWQGTSTFGETASLPGYHLVTLTMPNDPVTTLSDSGTSFTITG